MVNSTLPVHDVLDLIPMWRRPNNVRNPNVTTGAHVLLQACLAENMVSDRRSQDGWVGHGKVASLTTMGHNSSNGSFASRG